MNGLGVEMLVDASGGMLGDRDRWLFGRRDGDDWKVGVRSAA